MIQIPHCNKSYQKDVEDFWKTFIQVSANTSDPEVWYHSIGLISCYLHDTSVNNFIYEISVG